MSDEYAHDHNPYVHLHELELPQYVYENLVQRRGEHSQNNFNYDNMSVTSTTSVGETGNSRNAMPPHNSQNQNGSTHTGSVYEDEYYGNPSYMIFERKHMHVMPTYQMNPEQCIPHSTTLISYNQSQKRKIMKFNSSEEKHTDFEMSGLSGSGSGFDAASSSNTASSHASRNRNNSSYNDSAHEDDGDNSTSMISERKQNHCQIEKRRREKMNKCIKELSSLLPTCRAMARKLDKLTVLKMAVQHLRSIRGALSASSSSTSPIPEYISQHNLNNLVLNTAEDCFMFVVSCDKGKILYMSSSVTKLLQYNQNELIGQSVFDIIHPKDVSKVKEQLSSSNLPRERLVDARTLMPIEPTTPPDTSSLSSGARRSFICRVKHKRPTFNENRIIEEVGVHTEIATSIQYDKYCNIHCVGYLKNWTSSASNEENNEAEMPAEPKSEEDTDKSICLVAMGRKIRLTKPEKSTGFTSRNANDGKFLYVEQRVILDVGYLPQEIVGTSIYQYINENDLSTIAQFHKEVLIRKTPILTTPYNFKRKDGTMALIKTLIRPFKNPVTLKIECLLCTHTLLDGSQDLLSPESLAFNEHFESDVNMQIFIESLVESQRVGNTITEEVTRISSPVSSTITQTTSALIHTMSHMDNTPPGSNYPQIRNNVALSSAQADSPDMEISSSYRAEQDSSRSDPTFIDANGSAEMAEVMNLLESNAELRQSVEVETLPWGIDHSS